MPIFSSFALTTAHTVRAFMRSSVNSPVGPQRRNKAPACWPRTWIQASSARTGQRSLTTVLRYVRPVQAFRSDPLAGVL